ncbi:MAG: hypothetical protein UV92_C0024G0003 [Parcubacteria group bacterium GW2011_GWA1_43_27]|uniref:Glycosyltransferase RgtA/B/C/D-like domain-containing protein n=1 Tax=Candidatus Veblenbacteria bacterium RIFOXYC1_FULL_42_9 TaxID=1802427 RepID=A0A1G2Q744_9BACT|nr:MAG: hypothetical protein UV92_C0024G0003 [Parcubacteria group bacterium GW2011_GWA1_43_27]OHA56350.1 MAG: hypothetical protein A2429_00825 [Candidatus Veblenbacteria bacterium RIFOXYC1_FULL_42_9]HCM45386.1 hypothetical protein [Candidatus Veblenbacteria bacterium]
MLRKVYPFWRLQGVQLISVFVLCLAVFAYLQPAQTLADPDSWYHVKLTTMMRDSGLVRDFPWTQASLYRTIFIDQHFLYHVLLLPFVSLAPNDLAGAKIATIIFAAFSVTAVLWCLKRWRVPYWGVGIILLLTSAPFLFRLSLLKAPSLAIGVSIIAYYLITERRLGWLFFWTWFYVWFYSAWPLVVVMAGVWIAIDSLSQTKLNLKIIGQTLISKNNLKLVGVIVGGIVVALIINPYFPTNLVYLKQIFGMALTPYHTFVGIGGEWYPLAPFDLPENLSYPLLVWLLSTLVAVFTWHKQTKLSRSSWLIAVLFLVYTLKARRQTEYFVPWMVISSGLCLRDAGLGNLTLAYLKNKFASWIPKWVMKKYVLVTLLVYAIMVVPWGLSHGFRLAKAALANKYSYNTMLGAANWLKQNSPSGTIVFQSDWSMFPMLFYHNSQNYYLTGLDQTFMYEYDKEKYRQWERVVKGEARAIYKIAHDSFGASYLLLEKRTPAMLFWANRDNRLNRVYEDSEAIVYKLD